MADRILKPDTGNDLVLQNDDASAKININNSGPIAVNTDFSLETNNITNVSRIELDEISARTGTSITVTLGTDPGDDFNVGSGKLLVEGDNSDVSTTGTFKGNLTAGSGKTVDVSSGTFTTSTAQKQAISATAFASGTKMLFNQTSAPTGWTKDTSSNNNSALRVVTGTAGTGGSQDFTSAFGATISVAITNASHTLATSEIPSHTHQMVFYPQGSSHTSSFPGLPGHSGGPGTASGGTTSTGGGGSHTHSNTLSGTGSSGSTHNLSVKYVDVIIATKD